MANLINEAKRFQKLAGIITESQILSEAVKLDVLMKDGKPNSEILVVPNKSYSDKEELDANTMRPFQIKKEEGRKDMMVFTVVGRKAENQQFPIEGDEVADIILYNDAKSKLKESELNEDLKAEDIKVGGFYVAQMPTSNDGKERVDVRVRALAPAKELSPNHFAVEILEDKDYVNPVSKQQNRFKKGDHTNIEAKFLKPDVREVLDIEEVVNEALKSVRK